MGPYGPGGPGQPGGPPPGGKRNPKLLLIIGAAALALIVLVVGAAALFNRSSTGSATSPADPGGSTSTSTSTGAGAGTTAPSSAQTAPPTAKASDAVRAYLQALAAGHAGTALALSSEQPADKTFLTDAVLADSNARAPITAINVPEADGAYVFSVDASYKIGSQAVTDSYSVTKAGSSWKVRQAYLDLDLSYLRSPALPMSINKVPVKTDKIRVFPGSYSFSTGNKYVDYGSSHVVVLKSPSDYASMTDLAPTLTPLGTSAFSKAVEAKLAGCAQKMVLAPSGCPNGLRPYSWEKVTKSTVVWTLNRDTLADFKPSLDYQNPARAKASGTAEWKFTASGTDSGTKTKFSRTITSYLDFTSNLTQEPLKVAMSG